MARTQVSFFLSYAHADQRSCDRLLDLLWTQLRPSKRYEFSLWHDRAILPGEQWKNEILQAIGDCDLGLLLISPAFLGSEFITADELPHFVGNKAKPAIPVEVEAVDMKRHDLKGLHHLQLFRLDRKTPFARCTIANRTRFAEQLYEQIERRVERLGL